MVASFGTGHPRVPRRTVENAVRVVSPRHAGVAREAVTVRVDGVEQGLEVVRQPRHLGGTQAFWVCRRCSALRQHLYFEDAELVCRICAYGGLTYRSRQMHDRTTLRAAKLRRKLGAPPG